MRKPPPRITGTGGIGIGLFTWLIDKRLPSGLPIAVQNTCFCLAAMLVAWAVVSYFYDCWTHARKSEVSLIPVIGMCVSLVALLAFAAWYYIASSNQQLLTVSPMVPQLRAFLVVDSVVENRKYFHFQIKNDGTQEIVDIRYEAKAEELEILEMSPQIKRTLRAGDVMDIVGHQDDLSTAGNLIHFNVIYKIRAVGGAEFSLVCIFQIPFGVRQGQLLSPIKSDLVEGDKSVGKESVLDKFQRSEPATIAFFVPDKNDDGSPNVIHLRNELRELVVDPGLQTATFSSKDKLGNIKTLILRFDRRGYQGKGAHNIQIEWDENGPNRLIVDGSITSR